MPTNDISARVFISCGQRADSSEVTVAEAVAARLRAAGYSPYVAVDHQSLRSIRENVFPQLTDAEYFLFLDFRREALAGSVPVEYRGSLFSHQELAIASYLEKELLAFRESGVRPLDGLVGHLQANSIAFNSRDSLPDRVMDEVARRNWRSDWQNRLVLELNSPPFRDARRVPENVDGRFFHLRVNNRHRIRTAQDCVGYVRAVVNEQTGEPVPFESVELKWAGYVLPHATISPDSFRKLDAFWLEHNAPAAPRFNCFADSTHFIPRFAGAGQWVLTYEVLSATVPGSTVSLRVVLADNLSQVSVTQAHAA
jgi:hypothetical protein